jgi:hypothetical protein
VSEKAAYAPLRCTRCGSRITPTLEYRPASYSEHRDHIGYECDDCPARWDTQGEPVLTCGCFTVNGNTIMTLCLLHATAEGGEPRG